VGPFPDRNAAAAHAQTTGEHGAFVRLTVPSTVLLSWRAVR
jgi:hypothetical protein